MLLWFGEIRSLESRLHTSQLEEFVNCCIVNCIRFELAKKPLPGFGLFRRRSLGEWLRRLMTGDLLVKLSGVVVHGPPSCCRQVLNQWQAFDAEVGVEEGGVGGEGGTAVVEEAEADEVVAGYGELGLHGACG